jgi:hypothetical protein
VSKDIYELGYVFREVTRLLPCGESGQNESWPGLRPEGVGDAKNGPYFLSGLSGLASRAPC